MSIKLQILFVACIICAFALNAAFGRPETGIDPVDDAGLSVSGNSTDRQKRNCSYKGGCHKSYCWSYCEGFGVLSVTGSKKTFYSNVFSNPFLICILLIVPNTDGPEWCYTTRGSTQNRQYVSCSSDDDCSKPLNT